MENQEHPEFNEDAAFDEAAKSLETGELTADSLPSDADKTEKDKPDQLESEPEQQEKVEQDDLPDWLQSATDKVKENFRKLQADNQRYQHQARSQNGRVGALTKKYQQAAAELERLKQNQSTPQLSDSLARISGDYPEVAEVLNKYLAHQDKRLSDISQLSSQLAETKMQELSEQVLDSNIAYVTEVVPDAEQILANPQFTTWLQRQPVGKELSIKYQCSIKTIQRYIDKSPKTALNSPISTYLKIIMDTTFFGREFGVLVLMDSLSEKVIYHQIVSTERDEYYQLALNSFRDKNYVIQSVTCDGRRGLLKDLLNTPTQMCHFHLVAMVMRTLRKKHKSLAGKELKILIKTLKESRKNDFYRRLHYWYLKHQDYLNERSEKCNESGYFPYKHKGLRGAYASLKYDEKYLFTFEKYSELNIEKTTNRLEGLFSELKRKLINHNGLTKKRKIMFIKDFLNKKSC